MTLLWTQYCSLVVCVQGLNVVIPVVDSIKYVQSLKEIAIDVPQQAAITLGTNNKINK